MTRVLIIPQRDLLGQIAEYVVALDTGGQRWPLAQCEFLPEAQRAARQAYEAHRAQRITIETEEKAA